MRRRRTAAMTDRRGAIPRSAVGALANAWLAVFVLVGWAPAFAAEPLRVAREDQQVVVTCGQRPVLRYVMQDDQIARPYFTALHAPGGQEVTRCNPPREGIDPADHATMHPGVWLAFGDLGGADFWRNKGRVVHAQFVREPQVKDGVLRFAASNHYLEGQRLVCQEEAAYSLAIVDGGYLLTWDSTFSGKETFAFGDQEEMGLGIRLATPLCVKEGSGTITTSAGMKNEAQAWGTTADWCDYSGILDGQCVGVLLMPHGENFRPSWLHVRDYGLLVANPFGRKAFTKGEASRVEIKPGEQFRLRFGLWIYSMPASEPWSADRILEAYRSME